MGAPDTIKRLVDTFQRNIDVYKNDSINETQLRREFLDPFFTALGWDVENKAGYADAYKDVIHEYSLKTKDVREAPDYCFRIGGTRKFFVEAKKPSVNVKDDIHPAFQLRSYAWSAKLPLSVLTDFEEFAVYDCRIPPNNKDKASNARIMFITYDQFIDKWDEIDSIFSREAILKGSFDKYVESNKKKKGTAEVDLVFLEQMEVWRKALAKNIALRNPELSIRELNYSVQKTIDRIIFLRICEDRGIEDYGQLMSLQNGNSVYERLKQIFYRADEKYNSGLFHFENERDRIEPPDNLTLDLSVDDKTIKDIVKELYYPESPYEFSVLPADILGQVYEQFLGKVIRLTAGHQAVIEDKPEVKKAGGVYYTPTYIVDYIVNNTVGQILGNVTTPKEINKIKILDPACGSGSFLLGAYQYLLDWHLKFYLKELDTSNKLLQQKHPPVCINDKGAYLLTTSEKKRILLNNIYGVDIDSQAVEVTKLSLMLKVLEGESTQTLNNELQFFRERALPDLSNNVKCGNSLIGPDFYNQGEMNFLDDEEKMRINVFDWNTEFKDIINAGGFDVVIGNPPYYGRATEFSDAEKTYIQTNYYSSQGKYELYQFFIERSLSLLNRNGLHSFITPQTWLSIIQASRLREFIKNDFAFITILYSRKKIFKVSVDNIIYLIKKGINNEVVSIYEYKDEFKDDISTATNLINYSDLFSNEELVIDVFSSNDGNGLLNSLNNKCIPLDRLCHVKDGVKVVGPAKDFAFSYEKTDKTFFPMLIGKDIEKYSYTWSGLYCCRDKKQIEKHNATDIRLREEFIFENEKILIRKTGNSIVATKDIDKFYYEQTLFSISLLNGIKNYHLDLLLGIFNSKLANYLLLVNPFSKKDTFPQIRLHWLKEFPIIIIKDSDENLIHLSLLIQSLVNKIIEIKISFKKSKTPTERTAIERQIQATDAQIDQLVYQLYGLTEQEIKIVEGNDN